MQLEIEIVKVKQQKKMPEPTQKEDTEIEKQAGSKTEASRKPSCQEMMNFIAEQFRKHNEILNEIQNETLNRMREDNQRYHEKFMKRMDECLKNMNKTLDSTSEGLSLIHI